MKSLAFLLYRIVFLFVLILAYLPGSAQVPTVGDCLGAIPVCQEVYINPNIYSGEGNYLNEIPNCQTTICNTCCPSNCLNGEWNSAWYIFTVQQSGMLRFSIIPDVASDDYDWVVYDLTFHKCDQIISANAAVQKSCNAAAYTTPTGIDSNNGGITNCNNCGNTNAWNDDLAVTAGNTYVLYISNWGQSATGGYTLDFSASSAVIFDDVVPYISTIYSNNISGCDVTELTIDFSENVTCSYVTPSSFEIIGPGGPYTVDSVFSAACDVGGEWDKTYTLFTNKPFSSDGDYQLLFYAGFPPISDACGNDAASDTIDFTLDLGAPVIDESGLAITNAMCNVANGSITGLVITGGSGALSYYWTNQNGDTVGYDLDLIDVKSGNYTLEVHDEASCISYGGPYSIADEGAPEVEQTGLQVVDAICSEANGSITGLEVTGLEPFVYEWTNNQGQVAGTDLDLVDALAGIYSLTISDINNCEVIVGPWEILDEPAPEIVEDNMEVLHNICDLQNGAVQGLTAISNSSTLDFEWRDEQGSPVGSNEIDLSGVPGGLYTLTVIDDNNCESIGGPYQIEDFPSAVVDSSNMTVQSSTCGANDGSLTNLAVTGNGPFTYEWRDANGVLLSNSLDLLDVVGGSYTLTVFDANLCETVMGPLLIPDDGGADVDEAAMVMTPSNCYEDDGSITGLQVSGNPPFTYTWRDAGNNVVGNELDLLGVTSSLYTLEIRDGNDCISYSGPHSLDNIGGADINSIQSINPTCELENGRIIVNASGGVGNLSYSVDGGISWQSSNVFEELLPGSYNLQVLDEHDCITDYGSEVNLLNEGEGVDVTAGSNSPVCSGNTLQLNCDIDADQYLWTGPNGFTSNERNPVIQNVSVSDSGEYVLTVTVSTNNCQGVSTADVIVTESFTMDLQVSASKNPIYRGEEVVFTVQSNPYGYPGTYVWRIDGVEVQQGQGDTFTSSTLMDGQVVSCEMVFQDACVINNPAQSNLLTMVVEELPMHFPNSFRPTSPLAGNQVFKPRTQLDNIVSYSLHIYDRWGNLMFETQSMEEGWDGTCDGEQCPVGVYAFVARYTLEGNAARSGETYEKSGSVTLIK